MNPLRRGIISIKKNYGKNLMFLTTIVLLGIFMAGSIIVNQTVNRMDDIFKKNIPPILIIQPDRDEIIKLYSEWGFESGAHFNRLVPTTLEMIELINALPYVRYADYGLGAFVFSHLNRYNPPTIDLNEVIDFGSGEYWDFGNYSFSSQFLLTGTSRIKPLQFKNGIFELVEGSFFSIEDFKEINNYFPSPILIPRVVANLNNLEVGSILNMYNRIFSPPDYAEFPENGFRDLNEDEAWDHPYNTRNMIRYEFEIIGLFDINLPNPQHWDSFLMQESVYGTIFVPNRKNLIIRNEFMESELNWQRIFNQYNSVETFGIGATFILYNSLYIPDFRAEANKYLPDLWTTAYFAEMFKPLQNTMPQLLSIANQIMFFASGSALLILSLLTTLFLRDRKHEFGVYLALGEKKSRLIKQVLLETISVGIIGFSIAILKGNIISSHFSNELVNSYLNNRWTIGPPSQVVNHPDLGIAVEFPTLPSELEFAGLVRELYPTELLQFFDVSLNLETIIIIYVIGITTISLSTIIPAIYISELKPKEI